MPHRLPPGRILQSARWARAALGGPTDQCGFGVTVRCPAEQLRRLVAQYPEVDANCVHLKFPGPGQRDSRFTDAKGIIEVIMLMGGAQAARVRRQAAELVVRHP